MTPDHELLRRYAEIRSEEAFTELVQRHLGLVYSAALRQVNGDAHLAEDVAQTVFSDLARQAGGLSSRAVLTGWLYTSTYYAAAKAVRTETRRRAREQEAQSMHELLQDSSEMDWSTLRPLLDEAMHALKAGEREAILLRYFENRGFGEIGARLGLNENAARMRTDRALEKLRAYLARRGLTASTGTLSAAISANAVQAAPTGLAAALATAALAGPAATTANITALKFMAMTKLKLGVLGALIAASAVTTWLIQEQTQSRLRRENLFLRAQIEQLDKSRLEQTALSNRQPEDEIKPDGTNLELLKLRAEVAQLHRQLRDSARLQEENKRLRTRAAETAGQQAQSYVPSETWTNAGFSSPLNALQTAHWAIHSGDVQHFKDSILITDEARRLLDGLLAKMAAKAPPEALAEIKSRGWGTEEAILFPMMAQDQKLGYKGYRILSQDSPNADEMTMQIELEMNSANSQTNAMRFKRFGDNWKQVLDVTDLPDDVRNQALGN